MNFVDEINVQRQEHLERVYTQASLLCERCAKEPITLFRHINDAPRELIIYQHWSGVTSIETIMFSECKARFLLKLNKVVRLLSY